MRLSQALIISSNLLPLASANNYSVANENKAESKEESHKYSETSIREDRCLDVETDVAICPKDSAFANGLKSVCQNNVVIENYRKITNYNSGAVHQKGLTKSTFGDEQDEKSGESEINVGDRVTLKATGTNLEADSTNNRFTNLQEIHVKIQTKQMQTEEIQESGNRVKRTYARQTAFEKLSLQSSGEELKEGSMMEINLAEPLRHRVLSNAISTEEPEVGSDIVVICYSEEKDEERPEKKSSKKKRAINRTGKQKREPSEEQDTDVFVDDPVTDIDGTSFETGFETGFDSDKENDKLQSDESFDRLNDDDMQDYVIISPIKEASKGYHVVTKNSNDKINIGISLKKTGSTEIEIDSDFSLGISDDEDIDEEKIKQEVYESQKKRQLAPINRRSGYSSEVDEEENTDDSYQRQKRRDPKKKPPKNSHQSSSSIDDGEDGVTRRDKGRWHNEDRESTEATASVPNQNRWHEEHGQQLVTTIDSLKNKQNRPDSQIFEYEVDWEIPMDDDHSGFIIVDTEANIIKVGERKGMIKEKRIREKGINDQYEDNDSKSRQRKDHSKARSEGNIKEEVEIIDEEDEKRDEEGEGKGERRRTRRGRNQDDEIEQKIYTEKMEQQHSQVYDRKKNSQDNDDEEDRYKQPRQHRKYQEEEEEVSVQEDFSVEAEPSPPVRRRRRPKQYSDEEEEQGSGHNEEEENSVKEDSQVVAEPSPPAGRRRRPKEYSDEEEEQGIGHNEEEENYVKEDSQVVAEPSPPAGRRRRPKQYSDEEEEQGSGHNEEEEHSVKEDSQVVAEPSPPARRRRRPKQYSDEEEEQDIGNNEEEDSLKQEDDDHARNRSDEESEHPSLRRRRGRKELPDDSKGSLVGNGRDLKEEEDIADEEINSNRRREKTKFEEKN